VHDDLDSEIRGLLRSVLLPRLPVDRASKNGMQRRRSECLVPGMWGVDETKGLNPMEDERSKKVFHKHHPTGQDTYSDAGQTINDDFPVLSTNCGKAVAQWDCN
jgi:hypothetical protein